VEKWNLHERIADLLTSHCVKDGQEDETLINRLQVPNCDFKYSLYIDSVQPTFTFIPCSLEIFKRLVLRASQVEELSELVLTKCNL
jgi:hypothetical protein